MMMGYQNRTVIIGRVHADEFQPQQVGVASRKHW